MKKGSAVVMLGLFALFGLAFVSSSASASSKPRGTWRKFRVEYYPSQEPAVPTFLEEAAELGEVGDMHFGEDLIFDFLGTGAAARSVRFLGDKYGFEVHEEPVPVA